MAITNLTKIIQKLIDLPIRYGEISALIDQMNVKIYYIFSIREYRHMVSVCYNCANMTTEFHCHNPIHIR